MTAIDPSEENELYGDYSVDDEDQPAAEDFMLDDEVDEAERGYSPPERYSTAQDHGTTHLEQQEGESFDQREAQEVPEDDPYDLPPDGAIVDGPVDDGEVGQERAGRLLSPDEGVASDDEPRLVGEDVGIDGAATSAEEAAVHVVPEFDPPPEET